MLLDTSMRLELVLAGAITTNALEWSIEYMDYNLEGAFSRPAVSRGTSNNTTDVVLTAAPGTYGMMRQINRLSVHNADTVNATVIIKYDVAAGGGTQTVIQRYTLSTLTSLHFEAGQGWYVL